MKKAISYLRFSTPEQALGNSTERQIQAARNYCERNGLELDESLSIADEGLSGYKGHHVERGSLGHFLAEVKAGKIPTGTSLVIENLDRLSRQGPRQTSNLLQQLTDSGIDVHVISMNMVLRAGFSDDIAPYMMVGMQAYLAHQESKKKSERIGAAWKSKKVAATNGALFTSRLPVWLTVLDGKIVTVAEKVAVVREVFRMAALGIGSENICRELGDKVLSRSWVVKTLCNRAVLGEFQPKDSDVILNYFPQIVSQSEFDAARSAMEAKRRNGTYVGGNRRRSDSADNLFTGLVWDLDKEDSSLDRPMHFQKVQRGAYFASAFDKNRKSNRMRYGWLEFSVLAFFTNEDWQAVVGEGECLAVKQAQADLEVVLRDIDVTSQRLARTNEAMDDSSLDLDVATLKVLASRAAKDEGAIMTLSAQKDALAARLDAERAKCQALHKPADLLALINSPGSKDIRMRLRTEIAKRVAKIGVMFGANGIAAVISYINGVDHMVVIDPGKEKMARVNLNELADAVGKLAV